MNAAREKAVSRKFSQEFIRYSSKADHSSYGKVSGGFHFSRTFDINRIIFVVSGSAVSTFECKLHYAIEFS